MPAQPADTLNSNRLRQESFKKFFLVKCRVCAQACILWHCSCNGNKAAKVSNQSMPFHLT